MKKIIKISLISLSLITPVIIATPLLLSSSNGYLISNKVNNKVDEPTLLNDEISKKPPPASVGEVDKTNKQETVSIDERAGIIEKYQTELTIPNNYDIEYGKIFDETIFNGKKLDEINFELIKSAILIPEKVEVLDYSSLFKHKDTNSFAFYYKFKERPDFEVFDQTVYLGFEQEEREELEFQDFVDFFKKDGHTFDSELYRKAFGYAEGIDYIDKTFFTQSAMSVKTLLKDIVGIIDMRWIEESGLAHGYPETITEQDILKENGQGTLYKYSVYKSHDLYKNPVMSVELSNNVDIHLFEKNGQDYFEIKVPKGSLTIKSLQGYGAKTEYKNNYDFWFYVKDLRKLI